MPGKSYFPKPLSYLGFALIIAATFAGIYKTYFQQSSPPTHSAAVTKIIDNIYEEVNAELKQQVDFDAQLFLGISQSQKQIHLNQYLALNEKISKSKLTPAEALTEEHKFIEKVKLSLKTLYLEKSKK